MPARLLSFLVAVTTTDSRLILRKESCAGLEMAGKRKIIRASAVFNRPQKCTLLKIKNTHTGIKNAHSCYGLIFILLRVFFH